MLGWRAESIFYLNVCVCVRVRALESETYVSQLVCHLSCGKHGARSRYDETLGNKCTAQGGGIHRHTAALIVCVCVHLYVHVYAYVYICMHVHLYARVMRVCLCVAGVCMNICLQILCCGREAS